MKVTMNLLPLSRKSQLEPQSLVAKNDEHEFSPGESMVLHVIQQLLRNLILAIEMKGMLEGRKFFVLLGARDDLSFQMSSAMEQLSLLVKDGSTLCMKVVNCINACSRNFRLKVVRSNGQPTILTDAGSKETLCMLLVVFLEVGIINK
eukprot:c43281_g1_i1 orf=128-571(-)